METNEKSTNVAFDLIRKKQQERVMNTQNNVVTNPVQSNVSPQLDDRQIQLEAELEEVKRLQQLRAAQLEEEQRLLQNQREMDLSQKRTLHDVNAGYSNPSVITNTVINQHSEKVMQPNVQQENVVQNPVIQNPVMQNPIVQENVVQNPVVQENVVHSSLSQDDFEEDDFEQSHSGIVEDPVNVEIDSILNGNAKTEVYNQSEIEPKQTVGSSQVFVEQTMESPVSGGANKHDSQHVSESINDNVNQHDSQHISEPVNQQVNEPTSTSLETVSTSVGQVNNSLEEAKGVTELNHMPSVLSLINTSCESYEPAIYLEIIFDTGKIEITAVDSSDAINQFREKCTIDVIKSTTGSFSIVYRERLSSFSNRVGVKFFNDLNIENYSNFSPHKLPIGSAIKMLFGRLGLNYLIN